MFADYLNHIDKCIECQQDEILCKKLAAYWSETYEPHFNQRRAEIIYTVTIIHAVIAAEKLGTLTAANEM